MSTALWGSCREDLFEFCLAVGIRILEIFDILRDIWVEDKAVAAAEIWLRAERSGGMPLSSGCLTNCILHFVNWVNGDAKANQVKKSNI